MGGRFRLVANEVDVVEAPAPLPNLPVRPRRLEAASGPAHLHRGLADSRSADHTVLSGPLGAEELDDLAEMLGVDRPTTDWLRGCDLARPEPMTPAHTAGIAPLPASSNGVVACRETHSCPMVN
ncbi:hypothetical protein [Streptomyces erythrochromogenes]|uniref:hypothetical protein n=1 Tax=Streptomyces erythrochromogenes TaxID=285574 RepID=UPI0004CD6E6A|nr:hypothetical protein [Streptomyces erythrochromogenes]